MTVAEKDLLKRARAFDLDALSEIYELCSPGVYRYAVRLLGDIACAEDCTSETFNRFLIALKNGGGPEDFLQAYLYRIAHNWITDYYRRRRPEWTEINEEWSDSRVSVDAMADQRMAQHRLRAALVMLTPEQRQVVVLKFIEGWENQAIAKMLGKPVGAIKSLQHRALEALRKLLLQQERSE